MINEVISLDIDYEKLNLIKGDTIPTLTSYISDNMNEVDKNRLHPCAIICPGGGYQYTSEREGEPVALEFLSSGIHCFVLKYSCFPAKFPTALVELATAVAYVRNNAKKWNIDKDRLTVMGFSAGGHLAASLGVFWDKDFLSKYLNVDNQLFKPNSLILSYPVITSSNGISHPGSFEVIKRDDTPQELEFLSLEKQVSKNTPRTFLWHTFTDTTVPVENALLFATSLKKFDVPFELHIYPIGGHGLSLANEIVNSNSLGKEARCKNWVEMANEWIKEI